MSIQRVTINLRWKEINLFPGYFISNTGLFRVGKTISEPKVKIKTYYKYVIMINKLLNMRHKKDIHRLVWEHFGEKPKPLGYEIHHKDLDIHNNHVDNLVLVTKLEHTKLHSKKRSPNELKRLAA